MESYLSVDSKRCFTIDFDDWSNLARRDPEGFEARRRALLDSFIKAQPVGRRQRLRGLQWQVDCIRQSSSTPLVACQRVSQLMWDAFTGPAGLVQTLVGALPEPREGQRKTHSAKILPFPRLDRTRSPV